MCFCSWIISDVRVFVMRKYTVWINYKSTSFISDNISSDAFVNITVSFLEAPHMTHNSISLWHNRFWHKACSGTERLPAPDSSAFSWKDGFAFTYRVFGLLGCPCGRDQPALVEEPGSSAQLSQRRGLEFKKQALEEPSWIFCFWMVFSHLGEQPLLQPSTSCSLVSSWPRGTDLPPK